MTSSGGRTVTVEVVEPAAAERAQRRVAGTLLGGGLCPGDRVAFALGSSADLLCAVLGALRVGIVPVLLNPALLAVERGVLLANAEPARTVLERAELAALLDGPEAELAPWPLGRPMHYTSGTTGRAKGVSSGVLAEDDARALFEDEASLWQFDRADTHLVCSPMAHSVSIRFAGGTLLGGGRVVVLSRFDAGAAARALAEHRPTTTFLAPTALQRLLAIPGGPPLGSLRLLVHAGSACPPAVKRAAMVAAPPGTVWEFYGSTEGQFTVCAPEEWKEHPGTVGRARPGRRLEVDADGTVWCHVPRFARFAYWRDTEATAAAWRGDAFTVRDLGRMDDEGYLYLDGRREDLIITGGVNVYPVEIEVALGEHPAVASVGVFALSDRDWGEQVTAAVVPAAGWSTDRDEVAAVVDAWAQQRLAPYKRPKAYYVVDELPLTATGKLRRRELPGLLGLSGTAGGDAAGPGPWPGPSFR